MRKEDKIAIIAQLGELLKQYPHFYLVDVEGMNAATTSALRRKCFEKGLKMVVVKNTLLHKAFEASEIDFEPLYEALKGSTALMFTNAANVPAKLLKEYKDKKKEIPALKAAYAEEGMYVGADKLEELNKRPFKNRPGSRKSAFLEEEQEYRPLPVKPYEPALWSPDLLVGHDYLVSDGMKKYSVPFDLIGHKVNLRITRDTLQVSIKAPLIFSR